MTGYNEDMMTENFTINAGMPMLSANIIRNAGKSYWICFLPLYKAGYLLSKLSKMKLNGMARRFYDSP